MVSTIRINGVKIYESETLTERINKEIELTKEKLNEMSREARRSPRFKQIIGFITFLGTLGIASVAKAESLNTEFLGQTHQVLMPSIIKLIFGDIDVNVSKQDSGMWQLNQYMADTLFKTHDFFDNPSVITIYNSIWHIVLSFLTLMISKKGFDMIRARIVGGQSQGATEFIIRLLASCLMSFLSLDIMSAGIHLSNITTSVFMNAMKDGFFHFTNALSLAEAGFGAIFWFLGFIVMFVILGIRYWIRQIHLLILGVLAPIANMAWVTDGGSMLGTLIKEFVINITTPIVQSIVLGLGTVVLMQVATVGTVGFFNSVFIGLSTMVVMITVPDFLRKFTTGSVNPLKAGLDMYLRMKSMPLQFMRAFKG
jgi:hypothetical protein